MGIACPFILFPNPEINSFRALGRNLRCKAGGARGSPLIFHPHLHLFRKRPCRWMFSQRSLRIAGRGMVVETMLPVYSRRGSGSGIWRLLDRAQQGLRSHFDIAKVTKERIDTLSLSPSHPHGRDLFDVITHLQRLDGQFDADLVPRAPQAIASTTSLLRILNPA